MKFEIPPELAILLQFGEGSWLVGGAANPFRDKLPRDYDILVPHELWPIVSPLIPNDAVKNNFGGFKFNIIVNGETKSVDIWTGDLASVCRHPKLEWIYHMKTDTFFHKYDYRPPRFLTRSGAIEDHAPLQPVDELDF